MLVYLQSNHKTHTGTLKSKQICSKSSMQTYPVRIDLHLQSIGTAGTVALKGH